MEPKPIRIATTAHGAPVVFTREERERHIYIVGKSGSGIGRVAQPFGFRPHGSGHADFPHPALPEDNLRHAARTVQG